MTLTQRTFYVEYIVRSTMIIYLYPIQCIYINKLYINSLYHTGESKRIRTVPEYGHYRYLRNQ